MRMLLQIAPEPAKSGWFHSLKADVKAKLLERRIKLTRKKSEKRQARDEKLRHERNKSPQHFNGSVELGFDQTLGDLEIAQYLPSDYHEYLEFSTTEKTKGLNRN